MLVLSLWLNPNARDLSLERTSDLSWLVHSYDSRTLIIKTSFLPEEKMQGSNDEIYLSAEKDLPCCRFFSPGLHKRHPGYITHKSVQMGISSLIQLMSPTVCLLFTLWLYKAWLYPLGLILKSRDLFSHQICMNVLLTIDTSTIYCISNYNSTFYHTPIIWLLSMWPKIIQLPYSSYSEQWSTV